MLPGQKIKNPGDKAHRKSFYKKYSILKVRILTSTNWCILVAKLNIPDGLNNHLQRLQYPTACLIQNARRGLEICQTLSFWIKMANRPLDPDTNTFFLTLQNKPFFVQKWPNLGP